MKKNILGINIDSMKISDFVDLIEMKINSKKKVHVLGINAEKIVDTQKNKRFNEIIHNSEIIHADGFSILLASIFLGSKIPERVAGIDLMEQLLRLAETKRYTVYFLGAKSSVLNEMTNKLKKKYPDLQVAGSRNGYFTENEWINIYNDLKYLKPQIVFVGITSPIKEYLIDYLLKKNIESVFMGVGGSFDVLSGKVKRAPIWMQKCGLEWIFRLIQEPKRLFRRYLVGNLKFIKLLIIEVCRKII